MTIYIDHTHLGRHVTGLERITQELSRGTRWRRSRPSR